MSNTINNPHDKYVRALMQDPKIAAEFFAEYADEDLKQHIDLTAIELQNTSFITDDLKEYFSDLVYKCPYFADAANQHQADQPARMILLVEHQSTLDRYIPVRVFHYLFNFLNQELRLLKSQQSQQDKLPPFYALIFYNGKQSLDDFSSKLTDCFDDPLGIVSKMLNEPIKVINVNDLSDQPLNEQPSYEQAKNEQSVIDIISDSLKYTGRKDVINTLEQLLPKLHAREKGYSLDISKLMIQYLLSVGGSIKLKKIKQLKQFIDEISREMGDKFMTIAEQLQEVGFKKGIIKGREEGMEEGIEKGIKKGREEGIEKGIKKGKMDERYQVAAEALKNGISLDSVVKITKLTTAQVILIQSKLDA